MLTLRGVDVRKRLEAATDIHVKHDRRSLHLSLVPGDFNEDILIVSPLPDARKGTPRSWKSYAKLILPHVGLVIMCILYTIVGALIFWCIENPNEARVRLNRADKVRTKRAEILQELWDIRPDDSDDAAAEAAWRAIALDRVKNFSEMLFEEFGERYVSNRNIQGINDTDNLKWTFPSAVFFAATTITTIGYGDIVPATTLGRVICVVFGLFGVPLMLVTIADVGKFISDFIVFLYVKYYSFKKRLQKRTTRGASSTRMRDDVQTDLVDLAFDGDDVKIPVTIILLIVIGYTTLGGVLLRSWEEDWTFFDSFYFSFITMTTVGFGDYVPRNQDWYILSLIYIVLGLAITTMCVDLAGSQYIKKIHYFGRKIRSAKDALRSMGELMHYAAFLRKKYGLTEDELNKIPLVPDAHEWQEFLYHCAAFTPADINRFRYIDQRTDSIHESLGRTSTQMGSIGKDDDASMNQK